MFKKIGILSLAALLLFMLGGCVQTTTTTTTEDPNVALPDLSGMSRVEISSALESLDLTVSYYFDVSEVYTSEDQYDKFVMYGSDLSSGDIVARGSTVKVYTTPLNLTVQYLYEIGNYTDSYGNSLQLEAEDFQDKEFIEDGIGEVTVSKFVDGDTTWFNSGSQSFSVRYLGIDTPESTALYEPWGKAAAHFTQEVLSSAEQIVLQAEGERTDGNGRYLAWVWYLPSGEDTFLLLNLQLVELAYSKNKVSSGSVFNDILGLANFNASLTKRRVWGEVDPNYDYSKEGTQMSIAYLLENFDDYVGLKVVISAQITRIYENNIYLQDDSGKGINMYIGYSTQTAQLQLGVHLTVGALVPTYYNGSPQLSNFNAFNVSINTDTYEVEPTVVTSSDFNFELLGTLVTMEHLHVTSSSVSPTTGITSIYVMDDLGNTFSIRAGAYSGVDLDELGITAGDYITVTGPLSYYDYNYNNDPETYVYDMANVQLILTSSDDIVKD
ncbi:MAG: thermonuclease family protein [Firmicutes bacterium]|nr:thermonuclease family protein [Bacillota bacterium]